MSRYDGLIIPRSYSDYINKTDAATLLQALQLSGVMDAQPTAGSNHPTKSSGVYTALAGKQAALTFDDTPTRDSNNPVKSGGIYNAIKDFSLRLEKTVTLQPGANTVALDSNYAYLLVAFGSNYGQGVCIITQGYNVSVLKNTLLSNGLNFGDTDYSAVRSLTVTNNGGGDVSLYVLRIV